MIENLILLDVRIVARVPSHGQSLEGARRSKMDERARHTPAAGKGLFS